ncbi:MAG: hypothetical protein JSS43_09575, partial [Proteobacteria bacterium]|nr:hypothetical protein [Pseudomonadota bacterium]
MHAQSRLFRLTATVAAAAMLCAVFPPSGAVAQPEGPPEGPRAAASDRYQGDPPARVGRIAAASGSVSFRTSADTQWAPASVNYPVSSGNAFWADNGSQVRLDIADSRIVLAPLTEFDVNTLDTGGLQATVPQGEVYVHLRTLAPGETWILQTPRGAVRLLQPGRYGITVGSTEAPTRVTVLDGAAQIDGPGVAVTLAANETASLDGTDSFTSAVGPLEQSVFFAQQVQAEQPPPPASLPPAVAARVAQMPGGGDLYQTGRWAEVPEYGQVWYPPVESGWAPYRNGRWAWVAPWGWTWVDDAPWGFAPSHYGRWVEVGGAWAWTPGTVVVAEPAVYTPVYAPAVVAFVGLGAGVALGAAFASNPICWVPLGPREPYRPWYRASPGYYQRVNAWHGGYVQNTTVNNITVNNFVNRGAATVVPAGIMTGSRPVHGAFHRLPPEQFANARPVYGQSPIRPAPTTIGVTPSVARQLNLPPPLPGSMRVAPGPVVRSQGLAGGPRGAPGARANGGPGAGPGGNPVSGLPPRPALLPPPNARPAPVSAVATPHLPGQVPPGRSGPGHLSDPAGPSPGRPGPIAPGPSGASASGSAAPGALPNRSGMAPGAGAPPVAGLERPMRGQGQPGSPPPPVETPAGAAGSRGPGAPAAGASAQAEHSNVPVGGSLASPTQGVPPGGAPAAAGPLGNATGVRSGPEMGSSRPGAPFAAGSESIAPGSAPAPSRRGPSAEAATAQPGGASPPAIQRGSAGRDSPPVPVFGTPGTRPSVATPQGPSPGMGGPSAGPPPSMNRSPVTMPPVSPGGPPPSFTRPNVAPQAPAALPPQVVRPSAPPPQMAPPSQMAPPPQRFAAPPPQMAPQPQRVAAPPPQMAPPPQRFAAPPPQTPASPPQHVAAPPPRMAAPMPQPQHMPAPQPMPQRAPP